MNASWLILHAGALGDLALTIQLALRLGGLGEGGELRVVSRTDPGDLSACRPRITRRSSEELGLHWLFADDPDEPPPRLRELVRGRRVLSALGGVHSIVHHRLADLQPAALYSLDPRPRVGVERHITEQWQTALEAQRLLVPKCIHQHPDQRVLGLPDTLRRRGRDYLHVQAHCAGENVADERDGADWPCVVVIHPGSGGRGKCWHLRGFVELARILGDSRRFTPCFLLGPVELETWPASDVARLTDAFAVLRDPSADDLVASLAAAHAFVGNDAGPGHLAALLGTPTVTIFGPTSARVWRPLGRDAQVVTGDPDAHADDWGLDPQRVAALVGSG